MSFALGDYLKRALLRAKFVDASDMVDRIKAVKSPEELERIRRTATMQDKAMEETFAAIKPGMRELEVAAVAEHVGHKYGSEQDCFSPARVRSAPPRSSPTATSRTACCAKATSSRS